MNIDRNKAIADMRAVLSIKAPASGPTYSAMVCASVKACIERWAPLGSTYRKNADSIDPFSKHVDFPEQKLRGILTALAFDYENDRVGSFTESEKGDGHQRDVF